MITDPLAIALGMIALYLVGSAAWDWIQVARFAKRDSTLHEVGHAMLMSVAPPYAGARISISSDASGVANYAHADFDGELHDWEAARRWVMLVCLAGHAAETVAGSSFNRDPKYRSLLHRISARSADDSDSAKWESLAREELALNAVSSSAERDLLQNLWHRDFDTLTKFFQENRRALTEIAMRVMSNGGTISADELKPYVAQLRKPLLPESTN